MFKVKNGKITIFNKEFALVEGTNTIKLDENNNLNSSGTEVCTYSYVDGVVKNIESRLPKDDMGGGDKLLAGRYRFARRQYGLAPIASGKELDVSPEGFAFDYNYMSISYISTQAIPYMFVGGRVCHSGFMGVGAPAPRPYTAIPMIKCGAAMGNMADTMGAVAGSMMTVSFAAMQGMAAGSFEWSANAISFAFSYRTGKKYLYFKRGYRGLYQCGAFKGGDHV